MSLALMSLSATAGWQRSWTMVNGQHLLRISGPWWFTCRRQQQQQQHCAVRPPPSWACFVCRPNNWPYLWDILAFYVSIFPLALHTFLALWPGQVTTILVSLTSQGGSIVLGLVFVAHELPSVSNFMLILWASKLVYCPLYGQTVCLCWPWPDAEAKKTNSNWEKNRSQARHLACARTEQRCGYLYVQVISYARSAASLRSSLVHLIIYLFYIYVFLGLTTVL